MGFRGLGQEEGSQSRGLGFRTVTPRWSRRGPFVKDEKKKLVL